MADKIILAIDTSCDETSVAVTQGLKVLSNVVWSQASMHAEFGGVYPTLAKREHEDKIDHVIDLAVQRAKRYGLGEKPDAIAVTLGPGLAPALEVGIRKAKELAEKYKIPLIPINHIEAHLWSSLALPYTKYLPVRQADEIHDTRYDPPALGLVVSGGNTLIAEVEKIGKYRILAKTTDDALGEALDKAARLLGLGYPGASVLEKMARLRKVTARQAKYTLPVPLVGREKEMFFSYSGLKTAFVRLVNSLEPLNQSTIYDLSSIFQIQAFTHFERVLEYILKQKHYGVILAGGGVTNNIEFRKRIRRLGRKYGTKVLFPYTRRLCGDNAGMIGVLAHLKASKLPSLQASSLERIPKWELEEV